MNHREQRLVVNVVALILIVAIIVGVGIYFSHAQNQVNNANRAAHCALVEGTPDACHR